MKAMILAAGQGTRMGDLTLTVPKPLLPVAGKPIISHILDNLARHGFDQVLVNLHHLADAIPQALGDGTAWGVRLSYVREPGLLGTAGSVKNAEGFFDAVEPFLVHYGDVITDQDLGAMLAFHRERAAMVTLLLHQRARSNSIVCLGDQGRVERLLERPTEEARAGVLSPWVNSGVYLCDPQVLAHIPSGKACDFPREVFPALIAAGRVYGFPLSGYRIAVDSPERLAQAREDLQQRSS
jgi:NDP-sugar pyrophosphorylase family protein